MVFSSFPRIVMVSWELTLKYGVQRDVLGRWLTRETRAGSFLSDVTRHLIAATGDEYIDAKGLMIPDPLAMCVALRPDIIKSSARHAVFVETAGRFTRGMTVVDWSDASKKPRNVEVVDAVDGDAVTALLLESVRP